MVAGNLRSRTLRRVHIKTPGARNKIHYKKRKPSPPHCAETGQILPGVARGNPADISKLSKSQRVPSRPFGGKLSSRAMRDTIKRNIRASLATSSEE